jgi:HD-GYP domain-containing protein (c-di-GMP phosphodiesterase class II)
LSSVSQIAADAVVSVTPGPHRANTGRGLSGGLVHTVPSAPPRLPDGPSGDPYHATDADPAGRLFVDALLAVGEALGAKDAYTRRHSKRVSAFGEAIGREMGLSSSELCDLRLAGQLHDVGKIGIPDDVLGKAGPLDEEEYARLKQHPVIGEQILRPLLHDRPTVLAVVRWHHERFDGRGFPDELRGEQIPLAARIVAVADSFDAMTSQRPYRSPLDLADVVAELEAGAGSQFDPRCVAAFMAVLRRALELATVVTPPSKRRRWRTRAPARVRPRGRPSPCNLRRVARVRWHPKPAHRRSGLALVGARAPPAGLAVVSPRGRAPPTMPEPGRRAHYGPQVPF